MKGLIWRSMLDSDFNERYWRGITQKYVKYDLLIKIFLAITSSGAVAVWGIWQEYPLVWKLFSSCAALISICSPILRFDKAVEVASSHAARWVDLRVGYADLWDVRDSNNGTGFVQNEHARLNKIFVKLESDEHKLKIRPDISLARRCQQDVLKSKRLSLEN
jgi:hypothetical protein